MSEPSPPPPPPMPPGPDPSAPASSRGLIARVFDLSFDEFVTPSIIKIIFVIGIVLAGLVSLLVFIGFAARGGGGVVLGLLIAPLVFLLYVLMARVMSELYLILFRIERNTRRP